MDTRGITEASMLSVKINVDRADKSAGETELVNSTIYIEWKSDVGTRIYMWVRFDDSKMLFTTAN
jgi:hypothetical protein